MRHGLPYIAIALLTAAASCLGADGTLVHLTFDEGSGTVAHDSSGNGYDGTLINAPLWRTGILGSALSFDGVSQLVDVANTTGLDFHQSDFTMAAWVRPGDLTNGQSIVTRDRDLDPVCQLRLFLQPGGRPAFLLSDANLGDGTNTMQAANPIPVNQWSHVAITRVAKVFTLYVNGVAVATATTATLIDHHTVNHLRVGSRYAIGGNSGEVYFYGRIDDVRVYTRALSAAELVALGSAVTDTSGNLLDGENNGDGVTSGDGTAGGDFVRTFTIATPKLQVVQVVPSGNSTVTPPSAVTIAFNKDVDAATVSTGNFKLVQAGPDGQIGTGDDIAITPGSVTLLDARTAKVDLTGVTLPLGLYRLTLTGTGATPIADVNGNIFDGNGDNVAGGDFQSTFTISNAVMPPPPTLLSAAAAVPNPAQAGTPITFTAGAQTVTTDSLVYSWDFGDGAQGLGSSVTHTFASPGSYPARVDISGNGGSLTSTVTVVVTAASAPPPPAVSFAVSKMTGAVNFAHAGKDSVKFSAILPGVAPAFIPLGTTISVNIQGAAVTFTLDKNGHAKSAGSSLVLAPVKSPKPKVNTFGGDLNLTAQLTGTFANAWGMAANTTGTQPITMSATVVLNGTTYVSSVVVTYSGKAKSGTFKK